MTKLLPVVMVVASLLTACQPPLKEDQDLLLNMLRREPWQFQYYLDHRDSLEIQIIYTRINRDAKNRPEFRSFYFNVDSACYFYPASTVKFPVVLMALEKLNQLNISGLDKYTTMYHDSLYAGQVRCREDTTAGSCLPSVAQYIKKILVVSDNDAHNRLYEFLGQRAANDIMYKKGYPIRLLQRVDRLLSPDENRHTEGVCFVRGDETLYDQPMLVNDSIPVTEKILKGTSFIDHDTLYRRPLDFSYKNFYPLESQQRVLRAFLFPESVKETERFGLTTEDRMFVLRYMSQLPGETFSPDYAADTAYFPAFAKYLMFGNDRDEIPPELRIFNKIGDAYGYLIDNAYIVDFGHHVEFMLSAVIATNTDQVFNDGKDASKKLGYPFMKDLGRLVYEYELAEARKRTRQPDLEEFKLQYDRRAP